LIHIDLYGLEVSDEIYDRRENQLEERVVKGTNNILISGKEFGKGIYSSTLYKF